MSYLFVVPDLNWKKFFLFIFLLPPSFLTGNPYVRSFLLFLVMATIQHDQQQWTIDPKLALCSFHCKSLFLLVEPWQSFLSLLVKVAIQDDPQHGQVED